MQKLLNQTTMKKALLTIALLIVALCATAQKPDLGIKAEQLAGSIVMIVDSRTQHTQIEQMEWPDGKEYIYLHLYDKNGEWVKRSIFRDAEAKAVELTPKQLKKLKSRIIDFAQFVANNDKHAIWAEINKYERNGSSIYVMDLAESAKGRIKLYPALGFMATTSDATHH